MVHSAGSDGVSMYEDRAVEAKAAWTPPKKPLKFFERIVDNVSPEWMHDDGRKSFITHAQLVYQHITQDPDEIEELLRILYQAVASEYGD